MLGSFARHVSAFADKNGFVKWNPEIRARARLMSQEELDIKLEELVEEIDQSEYEEDDRRYLVLKQEAASYAIEKAIRALKLWRGQND